MESKITKDFTDIECLFECETYWGQDGNLYSKEYGDDFILVHVSKIEDEHGNLQYLYTINK